MNVTLFAFTLAVAIFNLTPYVFSGLTSDGTAPVPAAGAALFFGHFLVVISGALWIVIGGIRSKRSGEGRDQLKIILQGILPIMVLAPITAFVLPIGLGITWPIMFTPLYIAYFVIMIGYAVVRHGLFDIKLTVVRSMAYGLSLITLAIVYYLIAYVISVSVFRGEVSSSFSVSPLNIALALALAFIFQPIKTFFDKITNRIFYRDRYDSEDFIARLSGVLTASTSLRGLLITAATEIGSTLKAEHAFFYVQYNHVHHVLAGTKHHTELPVDDAKVLNEYVKKNGEAIIVTEILSDEHEAVRRLLVSHKIAILMPLMRQSTVLGYLVLGDQRGHGYTTRDVKVLSTISDELVIAIQNALSVQEVKDINEHLEQRIMAATQELKASNAHLRQLDATKDEFVSMASHQLRTPLTSIKGYLSMVLEGDMGKISGSQRKVLEEAFDSSERMVRLIHDFLNVSRLQTGKFAIEYVNYDIVRLVKQEIHTLESSADKRGITIKVDANIDTLELRMDETKMRQVIMNFIDNALYYSQENTTVRVELKKTAGELRFMVHDTGIGVPVSEREHLFTKFYRASNARLHRPDGTGVGLFLAKKVITAHGGEVKYEAHEKGGSSFGFTMPLTDKSADK